MPSSDTDVHMRLTIFESSSWATARRSVQRLVQLVDRIERENLIVNQACMDWELDVGLLVALAEYYLWLAVQNRGSCSINGTTPQLVNH
jgi:hypothetical protein